MQIAALEVAGVQVVFVGSRADCEARRIDIWKAGLAFPHGLG